MAGRGPAPKEASQRRRRNEPNRGEWIDLPATVEKPVLPTLPRRPKGMGPWSARTRSAWNQWRKDPATTQFGEADIASALDLAHLHNAWSRGEMRLAPEIRLRMDGLGLTPKGKRDLRWRVPPPGELVRLEDEREQRATSRRRTIAAVDPQAAAQA